MQFSPFTLSFFVNFHLNNLTQKIYNYGLVGEIALNISSNPQESTNHAAGTVNLEYTNNASPPRHNVL
jgi:hypothetical protein